jgi:hypothetical protein
MNRVSQKRVRSNHDHSNHLTRRFALQAKKLTLIGVLAVAVAIAGCSDSGVNSFNNPDEGNFGRVSLGSLEDNEQDQGTGDGAELVKTPAELTALISKGKRARKHKELTVTVFRIEIEGGCWYLKTKSGNTFEPLFEQDAPNLFQGMRLRVKGHVDPEIPTICQIAPVFRIKQFEILQSTGNALAKPEEGTGVESDVFVLYPPEATDLGNTYPKEKPWASVDAKDRITLKGIYGVADKGCMFLKINGDKIVELNFQQGINPNIKEKTLIKVIGDYSLLTVSRCQLGPIFNVVYFEII